MKSRLASLAPVLIIVAVSFTGSYLFYTTGSFAISANQDTLIDASDWVYHQLWAIENDSISGSLEATSGGVLDFYVMNENDYRYWTESNGDTGSIYSRNAVEMLEWEVSIPADGMYFVVYSNRDSSTPEHVQASLHITTSRNLLWPVLVTGTVLTAMFLICMTAILRARRALTL